MASIAASSDGDASPASSVSVIRSRAGSASAACTAARRARSEVRSAVIDSILTELSSSVKMARVTSAPVPLWRRLLAEFLGSAFLAAVVIGSGHRRAAAVAGPDRAGAAGERGGDRGRAVRDHLDVRPGLRRPLQPGGVLRRCRVRRAVLAGRRGLPARRRWPGASPGRWSANLMFALPAVSISAKHRATPAHFLSEVIATLGLLLVIFALARSGRSRSAPAAVGAYIGAAYLFTSSTSFANPAITIGRMFSDTFAGHRPVLGAGVHRRADHRRRPGRRRSSRRCIPPSPRPRPPTSSSPTTASRAGTGQRGARRRIAVRGPAARPGQSR